MARRSARRLQEAEINERSEEEEVDRIFRSILKANLSNPSSLNYLRSLASEFICQGKPLLISPGNLERVLLACISRYPASSLEIGSRTELGFDYLVSCYDRSNKFLEALDNIVREELRDHVEGVLKIAQDLILRYSVFYVTKPKYFCSYGDLSQPDLSQPAKSLIDLIYEDSTSIKPAPSGFRDALLNFEPIAPLMLVLFDQLRSNLDRVSLNGNFNRSLSVLVTLVVSYPNCAKELVMHPSWIVKEPVVNFGRGRIMECSTILGAFLHISSIPDRQQFKGPHEVWNCVFGKPLGPEQVERHFRRLKSKAHSLYNELANVFRTLMQNKETREKVYAYIAETINTNCGVAFMEKTTQKTMEVKDFASTGFFVNLSVVMLVVCEPVFIGRGDKKREKIHPHYVHSNSHIDFSHYSVVNATKEETIARINSYNDKKALKGQIKYSNICHNFFMTTRVLNLGLMKALSHYKMCCQVIKQTENELQRFRDMRGQYSSQILIEKEIKQREEKLESYTQDKLCYQAQIVKDDDLLKKALNFYRLLIVWSVDQLGGFKMPLPDICPDGFSYLPKFFFKDALNLLIVTSSLTRVLDGFPLDEFINFIMMFMASPSYIKSPYLRTSMIKFLHSLRRNQRESSAYLFEGNPFCLDHLVKNLLKHYADIEILHFRSYQDYERCHTRNIITKLLNDLWGIDKHIEALRQIAEEDKEVCLYFLNFLRNDTGHVFNGVVDMIIGLQGIDEEQEITLSFLVGVANDGMQLFTFMSGEMPAFFLLPEMVDNLASTLHHMLYPLVGPQRESLNVKNAAKYNFRRDELLEKIVTIYVNIARADKVGVFPEAVGWLYDEVVFDATAQWLRRRGADPNIIEEFCKLGDKSKEASVRAKQVEIDLGDIPEEFICPISHRLMKDPVGLPTTINTSVDRASALASLLNGPPKDPFNRSYLTTNMLVPDSVRKGEIEDFLRSRNVSKERVWPYIE